LKEVAEERGHKYYEKKGVFIPPITDNNLLQTDKFINDSGLWVIAVLFYISAIFWVISYFRLIFTDVQSKNYPKDLSKVETKNSTYYCKIC